MKKIEFCRDDYLHRLEKEPMPIISKEIQNSIALIGIADKATWLENYVKHDIKSKGTGIPKIRDIIIQVNQKFKIEEKPITDQIALLNDLMSQEYTEDKLASILYLQLFWKNKHERQKIEMISKWFDQAWITDWNVCDWLCVRVLTPMLNNGTEHTIIALKKWSKSQNLWKARASLVPFAHSQLIAQHRKTIQALSITLIKREERFCKTAVGWVLREYSKIDMHWVTSFLSDYEKWTTKEVIRNATKYMKP